MLLEFEGVPIANDGTVHLRHRERIYFSYLITLKPTGSPGKLKVRGGEGRRVGQLIISHECAVFSPLRTAAARCQGH